MNNDEIIVNVLKEFFTGQLLIPRNFSEFQKGEGKFYECLNVLVQELLKEHVEEESELKVYFSDVKKIEIDFFEKVLFDLLPNESKNFETELNVNLKQKYNGVYLTKNNLQEVISGLVELFVQVRVAPYGEGDIIRIFSPFPSATSNTEYCKVNIMHKFLNACLKVKSTCI